MTAHLSETGSTEVLATLAEGSFQLRFPSLFRPGYGYAFPCDSAGTVNIDLLSECARRNYFFARIAVGREFALPEICTV